MTSREPTTARAVAIAILNRFDPNRNYAGPILDKLLWRTNQRQRATDLVFGTIRNQAAIDTVIARLANCPSERIPAKLLNIVRIGTYELVYSPSTAEYSIVNEAVENTKAVAGKKQTGFVNALLRHITRHTQNRQIPLSQADAKKTLPQTPLLGCEFDEDILPEPQSWPVEYLSTAFSLPKWLISGWLTEFGPESTCQVCFASNRKAGIYVRPNILKTTTARLAEEFRQADIDIEISAAEPMIKVKAPRTVTQLPGFADGLFSVQDITASRAAIALAPKADWRILDLCAAPGTKTTQLAELTGDKSKIIATDISSQRLEKVRENVARLGINSVKVVAYEQLERETAEAGPFDAILLDVPCSNTGVLAKRIEARYRISPKLKQKLTKIQLQLLQTAAAMIKPKGKICYSTCSVQKCENSELVRNFMQQNGHFSLESELCMLPSAQGFGCDGGYTAILTAK